MAITENGLITTGKRLKGEDPINDPATEVQTFSAENDIAFGKAVMRGAVETGGKLFAGASGEFIGVAVRGNDATGKDANDDLTNYQHEDAMGVKTLGYINVYSHEAVVPSDTVRIFHTAGIGAVGDFGTTADAGKSTVLTGVKFAEETTGAGIVALKITDSAFTTTDDV
jgi:hypothetical protein